MSDTEETIDFSPVELTPEYVLACIERRAPEWAHTAAKLKDASKRDADAVLFSITGLLRGLAFVAQDLLTAQGKERSAGQMDALITLLGKVIDTELAKVLPVESTEE